MPGGPSISSPNSAAAALIRSGLGSATLAGGIVSAAAGSPSVRMNFSNPAGSVTTRLRASGDVTVKVWGMSRGPYTNDPAGCLDDPAPNPERQFALKNIEPLILPVMNVQRRPGALPPQQLSHRHAPGDRFTAGLDDCQRAEEPKSLSFSLLQGDGA